MLLQSHHNIPQTILSEARSAKLMSAEHEETRRNTKNHEDIDALLDNRAVFSAFGGIINS